MSKSNFFEESELLFEFPSSWNVIRWDAHRFYGYVSGSGFKGVDFMAIHEGMLYLIEVKNYSDRLLQDEEQPIDLLLASPLKYAAVFLQKFEDSFDLIQIIQKYFLRKPLFKVWARYKFPFLNPLLRFSFFQKNDWLFWTAANQIIQQHPDKIKLVLWLEYGPAISSAAQTVLEQHLKDYFRKEQIEKQSYLIHIANSSTESWGFKVSPQQ